MYLIDSDVFISAKNNHYAFDIVPAFWDWLEQAHQAGKVFTIEKVYEEVIAGGDNLSTWMQSRPQSFRLEVRGEDYPSLRKVSEWVASADYSQAAASTFLSAADYYLVAQAHSLGYMKFLHLIPKSE